MSLPQSSWDGLYAFMPEEPKEGGATSSFLQMRKLRPREVMFPSQSGTDGRETELALSLAVWSVLSAGDTWTYPSKLISASREKSPEIC